MATNLKQRLLQDIAELHTKPYPNITLHVNDEDIAEACLVLKPEGYGTMHLTVEFPSNYPLQAPRVRMDSDVSHPNIFGDYICASILNTTEGWTPAYTLKGIAIQLLSFFGSKKIEQSGGGYSVDLDRYRTIHSYTIDPYICTKCRYGIGNTISGLSLARSPPPTQSLPLISGEGSEANWPSPQQATQLLQQSPKRRKSNQSTPIPVQPSRISTPNPAPTGTTKNIVNMKLPNEIILLICERLETEDLVMFAKAWAKVGPVISQYDVFRTRELQCFCFKKDYMSTKLGVGINIEKRGRIGTIESEFDLLSWEGFQNHRIRRSVQGVSFTNWLPLPISHGHWRRVKGDVNTFLRQISDAATIGPVKPEKVIYSFMNDVVVKLNEQTDRPTIRQPFYPYEETPQSTLTHASEKAIESYFHLFHLLLCMATDDLQIGQNADNLLRAFAGGANSKTDCPNLGHLLVASLISSIEMSEAMMKSIIKETVTRNVVWMLDLKGAGMAELSYMEPSKISEYRLQKTFDASKTSYRLLMFLNLFRRTAVGSPRKPLAKLRDEAFERHGAPPRGSAKGLADSIKRIHEVKNFPQFLTVMGIGKMSADWFTNFLRECVQASIDKGYSRMPITQGQALYLRQMKEPEVEANDYLYPTEVNKERISFFPGKGNGGGGRVGNGGYRGRGRGRGRY
ncbi:uncharacterized protein PAC_13112 [Phialocephala subalpina]|uniref:UBC core domain-containing protein n=1 Tax=Phialocephala subalpina TaxID=576137 RepID=A0A1L7XDW3_9HELO|nr:uncharacterized protein PAC_13112 [Phialocephala subalpina]